jgi:hypothetical protein
MPVSLMVAVNATEPETGLQSHWYRQHRSPYAPDPPEPDETPVSCRSNQVKAQFHLVQRQPELHDQLSQAALGHSCVLITDARPDDIGATTTSLPRHRRFSSGAAITTPMFHRCGGCDAGPGRAAWNWSNPQSDVGERWIRRVVLSGQSLRARLDRRAWYERAWPTTSGLEYERACRSTSRAGS